MNNNSKLQIQKKMIDKQVFIISLCIYTVIILILCYLIVWKSKQLLQKEYTTNELLREKNFSLKQRIQSLESALHKQSNSLFKCEEERNTFKNLLNDINNGRK